MVVDRMSSILIWSRQGQQQPLSLTVPFQYLTLAQGLLSVVMRIEGSKLRQRILSFFFLILNLNHEERLGGGGRFVSSFLSRKFFSNYYRLEFEIREFKLLFHFCHKLTLSIPCLGSIQVILFFNISVQFSSILKNQFSFSKNKIYQSKFSPSSISSVQFNSAK